jgi:hypothetical protein
MAKARRENWDEEVEVRQWLDGLSPLLVGMVLPEPPWGFLRPAPDYSWALEKALEEKGLATWQVVAPGHSIPRQFWQFVFPSRNADPRCWGLLDAAADGTSALVLLEYLEEEVPDAVISPELRLWVNSLRLREERAQEDQAARQAVKTHLENLPGKRAAKLTVLAEMIARKHEAVETSVRSTLDLARECGQLLNAAKKLVGHGGFLAWLEQNVPAVSARMAQHYMRLDRCWDKLQAVLNAKHVSHLTMRGAIELLTYHRCEELSPLDAEDELEELNVPAVLDDAEPGEEVEKARRAHQRATDAVRTRAKAVDALREEVNAAAEQRRTVEDAAREKKWEADNKRAEAEWERDFDLTAAEASLRDLLLSERDEWPAGLRSQFVAALRRIIDGLE